MRVLGEVIHTSFVEFVDFEIFVEIRVFRG